MALIVVEAHDLDAMGYRIKVDLFPNNPEVPEYMRYLTKRFPAYLIGRQVVEGVTETPAQYRQRVIQTIREICLLTRAKRIEMMTDGAPMDTLIGTDIE